MSDEADWQPSEGTRRVHVLVTKDDTDTFSAIALNLPGVGSCGGTEGEAMENVKEAIRETLAAYKNCGDTVPWTYASFADAAPGVRGKWIVVDAA